MYAKTKWKIGIAGLGNIGGIFARKISNAELAFVEDIFLYDINEDKMRACAQDTEGKCVSAMSELVSASEIIILAVKPYVMEAVLQEIKPFLEGNKIIISVAAAVSIDFIEKICGKQQKIIRTMPNTPALIGQGITAVCHNQYVTEQELSLVQDMLATVGRVELIEEKLFDIITATTGSSPAYVFLFIEAMADAAVYCGMSRAQAYRVVSEAISGAAKMVVASGEHPGVLKDQVCTPGGTTIEAIKVLEEHGFRHAVFEAVVACAKKAQKIEKNLNV